VLHGAKIKIHTHHDNSATICSNECIRDVKESAKIRIAEIHTKNPSDADADLLPVQNSLVPAIIVTAIQLSYLCVCL